MNPVSMKIVLICVMTMSVAVCYILISETVESFRHTRIKEAIVCLCLSIIIVTLTLVFVYPMCLAYVVDAV